MNTIYLILSCVSAVYCAPSEHELLQHRLDSINDFSFRLLENIAAEHEENFAVSPLSVWNLFSLLAEGAAGSTFEELMLQLQLPKHLKETQTLHKYVNDILRSSNRDVTFNRKAAMFADCSLQIHEEFCQSAYAYHTDVYRVDVNNKTKLANDINYYICVTTEGNVKDAVNEKMLENLRLLLVDAMYFKANWTHSFDPVQTKKESFYDHQGRTIGTVNMMYQKAPNTVSYVEELEAEILELSYGKREEYSMMIIQPILGNSLKKLLQNLAMKPYSDWSKNLLNEGDLPEIDSYVPRMRISSQLDLIQPLKYMGIYNIFDAMNAQLPGVSNNPLHVSKTVQKVELEVNEEGTKAAAATIVEIEDRILGQRFEVNRPFVYLILDKRADIILFAGVYTQPSAV